MKKAVADWKLELSLGLLAVADFAQQAISSLPAEVREHLPHAATIALVVAGISLGGRLLKLFTNSPAENPDGSE